MRLGRHGFQELEIEANTDFICRGMSEHFVIISFPTSQTVTHCIKRHARYQNEVYLLPVFE